VFNPSMDSDLEGALCCMVPLTVTTVHLVVGREA